MAPLRVMGTGVLQRPSDDAANPRGAKVPTGRRPCKEKHRRYARSERAVATDLTRIGDKARQEPTLVFTTLYHHITDVDNLRACYDRLPAHGGKTREGYYKVKRRTSRKKLGQSLQRFTDWARRARSVLRKGEMFRLARARVVGHLRYYAITDNAKRCRVYLRRAERILFTWLNRKSQRPAYTWSAFVHALQYVGWPTSRIRIDLNPCRRAEAR